MAETISHRIRQRLEALNLSVRGAAKQAGIPESTLRNIIEGHSQFPRGDTLTKLAGVLKVSEQWLLTGQDVVPPSSPEMLDRATEVRVAPDFQGRFDGAKDVPVLGTAAGSELGNGAFQLTTDVIDYARRPYGLIGAPGVYALYVEGESMSPRFEPGDLIFVHPHRKPLGGDYVVIQEPDSSNGEPRAFVKRLIKITGATIRVEQFNPRTNIDFVIRPGVVVHKVMTDVDLYGT